MIYWQFSLKTKVYEKNTKDASQKKIEEMKNLNLFKYIFYLSLNPNPNETFCLLLSINNKLIILGCIDIDLVIL